MKAILLSTYIATVAIVFAALVSSGFAQEVLARSWFDRYLRN
jgi:hypothetical protein